MWRECQETADGVLMTELHAQLRSRFAASDTRSGCRRHPRSFRSSRQDQCRLGTRAASLCLGLLVVAAIPCWADAGWVNSASIFEVGVSARALALGGSSIALADDEACVYYNPAALSQLRSSRASSLFSRPFGAYSYSASGVAARNWGAYLLLLDSDTLVERDLYGNPIGGFRYASGGLILGWGCQVSGGLSVGLQLKGYEVLSPKKGAGLSLSPCILLRDGPRTYGLIRRDLLATGTKFLGGHSEDWPSDVALGLSWQAEAATFSVDFTENLVTRGDMSSVRLGVEYTGFAPLVLRVGRNRDWASMGFSIQWKNLGIDFAYLHHYTLPSSYVVSLAVGLPLPSESE